MRCFQMKYNALECSLSLFFSYITLSLNPSTSLQKAVLLVKSLDTSQKNWLVPNSADCYSVPTNCCHTEMLYPMELEPLTDQEKLKYRFLYKIFKFLKITTLAK